ncbi:MAG: hypothetical protein AB7F59_04300 [Bdellovibrionales bacterium]
MLKKILLTVALVFGGPMAFADSAAEDMAEDLVEAAQDLDFADYQDHLQGRALERYGTEEMMRAIHAKAVKFKKFDAEEKLVAADGVQRHYDVEVYGEKPRQQVDSSLIATVGVQCRVIVDYNPGFCPGLWDGWDYRGRNGYWWNGYYCHPGYYTEREMCSITDVN